MYSTFSSFSNLGLLLFFKNKRQTERLLDELEKVLVSKGFTLPDRIAKRIFFYTSQSTITNHWFSLLRGYKPLEAEKKNALYLGAFTPIADDLMDSSNMEFELLLENPPADSAEGVLFSYLWDKLKPLRESNPTYQEYFQKAQISQNESLKQLSEKKLSREELISIMENKGGYSTLLYRSLLLNDLVDNEESAIFKLGAILQFINDLFDLYKDSNNKVQTLVTNYPDFNQLEVEFNGMISELRELYKSIPYSKTAVKQSYRSIFTVISRGQVALNQFKSLQKKEQLLNVEDFTRKPLIVDMEKPKNIYQSILETHRQGNLWKEHRN